MNKFEHHHSIHIVISNQSPQCRSRWRRCRALVTGAGACLGRPQLEPPPRNHPPHPGTSPPRHSRPCTTTRSVTRHQHHQLNVVPAYTTLSHVKIFGVFFVTILIYTCTMGLPVCLNLLHKCTINDVYPFMLLILEVWTTKTQWQLPCTLPDLILHIWPYLYTVHPEKWFIVIVPSDKFDEVDHGLSKVSILVWFLKIY